MGHKNLGKFINKVIDSDHVYNPIPIGKNASENKGFDYYIKSGDITAKTETLLKTHPEYLRYREYLDK